MVRKLIDRRLFPVLNALVIFYFVDQLRMVAASQAVLSRLLLLAEMLGGALFVGWLLGPGRFGTAPDEQPLLEGHWQGLPAWRWGWFAAGLHRRRAGLREPEQTPRPRPAAKRLYGPDSYTPWCGLFDGLFLSALSVPPLARLGLVKRHQGLLRSRARGVVEWAAILLWAAYVLEALSLRAPVFQDLREVLTATWGWARSKSPWATWCCSGSRYGRRFSSRGSLRFVLEEEVYPRVKLAPGLHYSISKMVQLRDPGRSASSLASPCWDST